MAPKHEDVRQVLKSLPRPVAPARLDSMLRVVASRERQRRLQRMTYQRSWIDRLSLLMTNSMRPLALPFAGGLCSAIVLFSMVMPGITVRASDMSFDVPTALSTEAGIKGVQPIGLSANEVVLDVTIDENGRMIDYAVMSGHLAMQDPVLRVRIENNLLFTQFTPPTAFGQPIAGRIHVSLTANRIEVKG
jgi:hypothetical protein